MISLVAFLGNYGKKYEGNRHNVAWLFDRLLKRSDSFLSLNIIFFSRKYLNISSVRCDGNPYSFSVFAAKASALKRPENG